MKKILHPDQNRGHSPNTAAHPMRENNWCEKYGYFIDLDACQARSLTRPVCRRCYKSLLQLSLPFDC
ncbi:MAG: hypothetical protein ABFD57_00575 [Smithella sp.]|nr:hypothetical protein [Syntrophaceae bacterium]